MTLGLGVVGMYGCNGDGLDPEMGTVSDSQDADAVTYVGPDDPTVSMSDGSTDTGASTTWDTTNNNGEADADASTYAGPDEGDSIGSSTTFGSDSGSDSGSGSGSGSDSGTSASTTEDSQEADASTYAGPDENATTTGS